MFFAEVYDLSRQEGWTSDEHFTADGTLIESWASLKSFVRKDGGDQKKVAAAKDDDPGNPTVNFHGEKRCKDTHQSTTDSESVLYRKAKGKEAKLYFGNPIVDCEPVVALRQLDEHAQLHVGAAPKMVGADKRITRKSLCKVAGSGESRRMRRARPA